MLTVLLWAFVVFQFLGIIAAIMLVGKERQPTTPGAAVVAVLIGMASIGILFWAITEVS